MSMTRREKRALRNLLIFVSAVPLLGAWGTMIEVGVLHSWWSFIPVMGMGVAVTLAAVSGLVVTALFLLKLVLLED